jgi:hypothetical protein
MPDIIDQSSDIEDRLRQLQIDSLRAAAEKLEIPAKGECYYCEEPLAGHLRFCDAACRDDYQRYGSNPAKT